jgi:hypothetical protein
MVSYSYAVRAPSIASPVLTGASSPNGEFQLSVTGATGLNYTVQASTDLAGWTNVFTTVPAAMPFLGSDTNSPNYRQRFYRVWLAP